MSAAKHTPGPWYLDTSGKRADYIRASGDEVPGTCAIAQMCHRGGWSEQNANARLIAAAPDLLEALRNYVDGCSLSIDALAVARAAIAKATGEGA